MLKDNLIEINLLLDILGYTDLRSVRTWLIKNKVGIITLGKKSYCVRNFIDHIIEKKINSFVYKNYENPAEVLAAVKSNDNVKLLKEMETPPVDEEVKIKFKKNKSENSKAAKNLLDKLKSS